MAHRQFLFWLFTIKLLIFSHFLADQCPHNWKQVGKSCYHLIQYEVTWYDAAKACHDLGGGLAVPASQMEQAAIWKMIQQESLASNYFWIGCKKDDSADGEWSCTEHDGKQSHFTYWAEGEPNYNQGDPSEVRYCARMKDVLGRYADKPCDDMYYGICETSGMHAYCILTDDKGRILSQCLTGHVIKELPIKGVITCGSACRDDPQCRSFNVRNANRGNKTCQLNDMRREEVESGKFVEEENCYYFEM